MKFEHVADNLGKYMNADPPFLWGLWFLWRTYSFLGRKDEAIQALKKIFTELASFKMIEAIENTSIDQALLTIAHGMAQSYASHYTSPYNIATLFAHAGEKEETLKWLKESIDVLDPRVALIMAEPEFHNLRNDERFKEYVKKTGL